MASWAKNQIAKQLAKFAKNLDPSQISLKFLKGEGELVNLELNEELLSQLLEFPPWLHLKKATCNRISAKVKWTSLKTDPIRLFLDCVEVEIVAVDEARERVVSPLGHGKPPSGSAPRPAPKPSKYGFIEKVVDGMFVSINTVMATFRSVGFKASFSMSRIIVQSTTPSWTVTPNLRFTRIKDDQRGQVLNFKEIRWGTLRLDADASSSESYVQTTPLRLITNNSSIRITIKKRLADCTLVSSKLEVVLDDILWVLTESQLLKLSSFVQYIVKLRMKYLPLTPHTGDLEKPSAPRPAPSVDQQFQGQGQGTDLNRLFTKYDVIETSYHITTRRIDLHFCDDQTLDGEMAHRKGSKNSKKSEAGGAIQISLMALQIDHCPYHIAGVKRTFLRGEDEVSFARRQWAHQLMEHFMKVDAKRQADKSPKATGAFSMAHGSQARRFRPVMYENFFLFSCKDFEIMQVTNTGTRQPKPFLSSDKLSLHLPEDMDAFYIDYTSYYHTGMMQLPVPAPNIFLKANPVQLTFHPTTCIWLSRLSQSIVGGLEWTKEFFAREFRPPDHLDIRIEALMPKIIIPNEPPEDTPYYDKRPKALQLQIAQAVISNSRIGSACSQSDLLMDLQYLLTSKLYTDLFTFPNKHDDVGIIPNENWINDYSLNHRQYQSQFDQIKKTVKCDLSLITHPITPRQIWCLWADQMWIEFLGISDAHGRPVTFVDAIPFRVWACVPLGFIGTPNQSQESTLIDSTVSDTAATLLDISRTFTPEHDPLTTQVSARGSNTSELSQPSTPVSVTPKTARRQRLQGGEGSRQALSGLDPSVHSPEHSRAGLHKEGSNPSVGFEAASGRVVYTSTEGSAVQTSSREASNAPSCSSRESLDRNSSYVSDETNVALQYFAAENFDNQDVLRESLRHSHSETSLLPKDGSLKRDFSDTQSLVEFSTGSSTFYDRPANPGINDPPPPYYPYVQEPDMTSSAYPNRDVTLKRRGSDASLPPRYDVDYEAELHRKERGLEAGGSGVDGAIRNYFTAPATGGHLLPAQPGGSKTPAVSVIVHVPKKTTVQLDHFQLIFLLRLQDMFGDFAEQIADNSARMNYGNVHRSNPSEDEPVVSVNLSVPDLEIDLILPPCRDRDPKLEETLLERMLKLHTTKGASHEADETQAGFTNGESAVSAKGIDADDSTVVKNLGTAVITVNSQDGVNNDNMEVSDVDGKAKGEGEVTVEGGDIEITREGCYQQKDLEDSSGVSSSGSSPLACAKCHGVTKKATPCECSKGDIVSVDPAGKTIVSTGGILKPGVEGATKSVDTRDGLINFEETSVHVSQENIPGILRGDDPLDIPEPTEGGENIMCTLQPGPSLLEGMDEGRILRSACSSPEIAVDEAAECLDGIERTGKAEHEKKPLSRQCGHLKHRPLEEDDVSPVTSSKDSTLEPSQGAVTNDKYVSVVQLMAKNVRVGIQVEGDDTSTKVTIETIRLEEKGNVLYNRTSNHRLIFGDDHEDVCPPTKTKVTTIGPENMICVRVDKGPKAESFAPRAAELGFTRVCVNALEACLRLSTTDALAEFAEDETVAYTPPFLIGLEDLRLTLIDDKPRTLLSAPVPVPLQICIDQLDVRRSCDGIIQLTSLDRQRLEVRHDISPLYENMERIPLPEGALAASSLPSVTDSLASRIDELENENERLIEDLKVANNRMSSLEEERDTLLKVIDKLQQELMWSNHENERLQSRLRPSLNSPRNNTVAQERHLPKRNATATKFV